MIGEVQENEITTDDNVNHKYTEHWGSGQGRKSVPECKCPRNSCRSNIMYMVITFIYSDILGNDNKTPKDKI